MINYKVLKLVDINKTTVFYLVNNDFEYKTARKVFSLLDLYVYQDVELLVNIKNFILDENSFNSSSYSEVERLFLYVQSYVNNFSIEKTISHYTTDLLKDIEHALVYWDDYN